MKRATTYLLLAALLAQPIAAFADKPAPTEPQKAEARARYERGLKLYDQGAYEPALVEMRRAYELHPTYKILYNIGLIHKQLNDHAAALDAFNGYLAEGGKKIDPKRHAEVEKYVSELKPLVATLEIMVDLPGAEITVDDAVVGTSPMTTTVTVNAGKRKVTAKIAGKPAATRVVTVAGSDALTVKLELDEPKTTATTTTTTNNTTKAPSEKAPAPGEPTRQLPWLWYGVTGALAVGAGTMGFLALRSSGDLSDKRSAPNTSRDDLDSASSRTKTFALVTDVLLVSTIAAAGLSLYLTINAPKTMPVTVGISPTGFALAGSF